MHRMPVRISVRARAVVVLVLAAGCNLATDIFGDGELRVSRTGTSFQLRNTSDRAIYYFAIEEELAARTFWGPCDRPESCPRVPPRSRIELPYDSVAGFGPDAELALVYWWHLVPKAGGGHRADSVRVVRSRY